MKVGQISTNFDAGKVKLWEYDQTKKINGLINYQINFSNENIAKFWDDWYNDIFNLDTAKGFGLNIWGKILGVSRPTYEQDGSVVSFSDDQYRTILKGRLMLMNSNGSIRDFNKYLNALFPNSPAYVVDYHDMSVNLILYFNPTDEERAIIESEGFLPLPTGVEINYVIVPPDEVFGFYGQELSNFENGSFLA